MDIAIIGAGYVGTTTGIAFAHQGHRVVLIDTDEKKINTLKQSTLPFYEEGMEELLKQCIAKGNLSFSTSLKNKIDQAQLLFITVGTPSLPDGVADLSAVEHVARQIGRHIKEYKVIVVKSTVPVGTGDKIKGIIQTELQTRNLDIPFDQVSNPEFLREGKALYDAMNPDRIVIGCNTEKGKLMMQKLYKEDKDKILFTSIKDAEMIKYASNSFLATKISFINELARLCEKTGVNIMQVAKGMGLDQRIGPQFLQAGIGYGGSCFPKDTQALLALAKEKEQPLHILQAVTKVNQTQVQWFMEKVKKALGNLAEKRITLLGLTFKPQTDDIRESSSLKIIDYLLKHNAIIKAYDPKGMEHVKKIYPSITYASTPIEAVMEADALLLVTEWKEIIELDWNRIKLLLSQPYVFDGRNALDPSAMVQMGYFYEGIGNAPSN